MKNVDEITSIHIETNNVKNQRTRRNYEYESSHFTEHTRTKYHFRQQECYIFKIVPSVVKTQTEEQSTVINCLP